MCRLQNVTARSLNKEKREKNLLKRRTFVLEYGKKIFQRPVVFFSTTYSMYFTATFSPTVFFEMFLCLFERSINVQSGAIQYLHCDWNPFVKFADIFPIPCA